jgi:anthranilate phosphoribosyltransferase
MIKETIEQLVSGKSMSMEQASTVMDEIMEGKPTPAQLAAFLTALRMKGETPEELAGMATVMRDKALRVDAPDDVVDTCGTGGDRTGTFNISTTAAFVAAGAGLKVAKHGSRAVSGKAGSADVLEVVGVKLNLSPEAVKQCIDEVGIGFMFAPAFHLAMKHALPVRQEIGIRTVFNILGPLTNPARAKRQLLGVATPALGEKLIQVLKLMGAQRAMVVHGEDGLDEVTLGGKTHVWDLKDSAITEYDVTPADFGLSTFSRNAVRGGDARHNAYLLREVLNGTPGPFKDIVVANAAAVMVVSGKARDFKEGATLAEQSIKSGAAIGKARQLVALTQRLATAA